MDGRNENWKLVFSKGKMVKCFILSKLIIITQIHYTSVSMLLKKKNPHANAVTYVSQARQHFSCTEFLVCT
jgi:hypothetical protein